MRTITVLCVLLAVGIAQFTAAMVRADDQVQQALAAANFKPGQLKLPLTVSERSGVDRKGVVVSSGVPFPPGFLPDLNKLAVVNQEGQPVLTQVNMMAAWHKPAYDDSAQWVLVSFPADCPATEAERLISQWAAEELGSELLFVTGYHVANRPMYAMPDLDNPPLTRSFDLLFHGVEITTGSQRIHDYEQLVASIRSRSLDPEDYEGYLEAFKHGMPPHGGMGMGIERLVKQMLGLSNIKQATLFPRDRRRLTP